MARAVTMHGGEFTQCVYQHRVDLRYANGSRSLLAIYKVYFEAFAILRHAKSTKCTRALRDTLM
jgi:hypothetical protein